jgi:hypothetical protein
VGREGCGRRGRHHGMPCESSPQRGVVIFFSGERKGTPTYVKQWGAGRYVMCSKALVVVSGKNRLICILVACAGGVRSCPGPSAQSHGDSSGFAGRPVAELRCGVWWHIDVRMHGKERGRGSGLVRSGLVWLGCSLFGWCGRMFRAALNPISLSVAAAGHGWCRQRMSQRCWYRSLSLACHRENVLSGARDAVLHGLLPGDATMATGAVVSQCDA